LVDDQEGRVFCKAFDGKWGGEDGFVGLTVFRRGGRLVMLGRKSYVTHQWHSRSHTNNDHLLYVDTMDHALMTAINQTKILEAPKTYVTFARMVNDPSIEEAAQHVAYASFPPHLAQVMSLFPKDSLFLSVVPLFISTSFHVIADYNKTPMLAYDHKNKEYVRRCVEVLRKADVIALPDGRLQLNPASNLDVSKGN
jgi:hypothetical protein